MLGEIKSNPRLRQIPDVVMTTSRCGDDILSSYGSGAGEFISKAVTFNGLVEVTKGLGRYWFEIVELHRQEE